MTTKVSAIFGTSPIATFAGDELLFAVTTPDSTPGDGAGRTRDILRLPKIETIAAVASSRDAAAADKGSVIVSSAATAITITFPASGTLPVADFPIGAYCWIVQGGTGTVSAAAGAGATLLPTVAYTRKQEGWMLVQRVGADAWRAMVQERQPAVVTISTASANLEASWHGDYVRFTNVGAKQLTIRDNSAHAVPDGYMVGVSNSDTAEVLTLVEDTSVTITPSSGGTLVLGPGMSGLLVRVGVDAWEYRGQSVPA